MAPSSILCFLSSLSTVITSIFTTLVSGSGNIPHSNFYLRPFAHTHTHEARTHIHIHIHIHIHAHTHIHSHTNTVRTHARNFFTNNLTSKSKKQVSGPISNLMHLLEHEHFPKWINGTQIKTGSSLKGKFTQYVQVYNVFKSIPWLTNLSAYLSFIFALRFWKTCNVCLKIRALSKGHKLYEFTKNLPWLSNQTTHVWSSEINHTVKSCSISIYE